jgi:hypothetical protein
MTIKKHIGTMAMALAAGAALTTFSPRAEAQHRIVGDFADPSALTTLNGQARATFAVWTTWGSGPGGVTSCPTPGDWVNCWVYWQPEPAGGSTYAALRVEPYVQSHYHLGFDDSTLTCFVDPGDGGGTGFGRPSGGSCIAPNWAYEGRTGPAAHLAGEWYYVTVETWNNSLGSQGYRLFDLESFVVTSEDPVDLWVLWFDGFWYVLEDLPPGYNDVSWWAYSVSDVMIGSDTTYTSIDDVIVSDVHF